MRRRAKVFTWPDRLVSFAEDEWVSTPLASVCGRSALAWLALHDELRDLTPAMRAYWRRALAWEAFAEARQGWLDEHQPDRGLDWHVYAMGRHAASAGG